MQAVRNTICMALFLSFSLSLSLSLSLSFFTLFLSYTNIHIRTQTHIPCSLDAHPAPDRLIIYYFLWDRKKDEGLYMNTIVNHNRMVPLRLTYVKTRWFWSMQNTSTRRELTVSWEQREGIKAARERWALLDFAQRVSKPPAKLWNLR